MRLTDTTKADTVSSLLKLYAELKVLYPKSVGLDRLPLDFLSATHPEFRTRLSAYMSPRLRKGLPSLFRDIRGLYVDLEKTKVNRVH